jgi:hypothetical protein
VGPASEEGFDLVGLGTAPSSLEHIHQLSYGLTRDAAEHWVERSGRGMDWALPRSPDRAYSGHHMADSDRKTPLEKVEALYEELVDWYEDGSDREIRAASKLLMIGLLKLKAHGGFRWQGLVEDYVLMLKQDPERYERILEANRGEGKKA